MQLYIRFFIPVQKQIQEVAINSARDTELNTILAALQENISWRVRSLDALRTSVRDETGWPKDAIKVCR